MAYAIGLTQKHNHPSTGTRKVPKYFTHNGDKTMTNTTTVTAVTNTEAELVSPMNDAIASPLRVVENETNVTRVTQGIDDTLSEFFAFLEKKWFFHKKYERTPVLNDSGIWRFEDFEDEPGKKSGWASPIYSEDGTLVKVVYGSFRMEEEKLSWEPSAYTDLSDEIKAEYQAEVAKRRQIANEELEKERSLNRATLSKSLNRMSLVKSHSYLERKGVQSYGLKKGTNDELVIPLRDINGELITAQRIKPDGEKRLWAGCGKKGSFLKIAGDSRVILIAEGYATAASLYEATGYTSIMAIDAGNLQPVAAAIKAEYSNSAIVICCDNDQYKARNTGKEKGQAINAALGIPYVLPKFDDLSTKPTDFNDLAQLQGNDEVASQIAPVVEKAMLRTPVGFAHKTDGLYKLMANSEGQEYEELICSPIKVTALTRDTGNHSWGRLIELEDRDKNLHRFAMPMTKMTGQASDFLAPLVDKGLTYITSNKNDLHGYLTQANPITRARCVDKTGWFNQLFVLPEEVIGESQETIIFQSNAAPSKGFETSGTLEEWQQNVASLCVDNSRLLFGVSTAFATALLPMIDGESGGFHFRCGSSRGKTTILMMAKSVWGTPESLPRWRATANGLEGLASIHNHSLLCLDEFSQLAEVNPKVAGETIYMLGNGEGKQRSQRDGSMARRQTWQLLYLSAGEVSLKAVMEQAGHTVRAGQEVRFIDLPADAGKQLGVFDCVHDYQDGNRYSLAIKENSQRYHGTAARAFISAIAADYHKHQDWIIKYVDEFVTRLKIDDADPQVQRVARRFGLIAAAGELATNLDVTGWDKGQATQASVVCFDQWIEERGGSESHEESKAIETIKGRLLEHGSSRFLNIDNFRQNGSIWGLYENSNYYVYSKAFKDHLCAGLDAKFVANLLIDLGHLKSGKTRPTISKRIDGKPTRCYHILPSLFDEQDETDSISTGYEVTEAKKEVEVSASIDPIADDYIV